MENTVTMNIKDIEILKEKERVLDKISRICDTEPEVVQILKSMVVSILKVRENTEESSRVLDVNLTYKDYKENIKETYAKRFKNADEKWDDRNFM